MYPPQELSKYPPYDHCFTTIANEILASSNNRKQRSGSYFVIIFNSLSLELIFPSKQCCVSNLNEKIKVLLNHRFNDSIIFCANHFSYIDCEQNLLLQIRK